MIEFFMPMKKVPTVTHQMKKVHVVNGKPILYEPYELKRARSQLTGLLSKNAPQAKFGRSVRLVTKWCFPITGNHYDGEYKYTKPDTDNLQKLLKDCMTATGYWTDDALVVSEITEKFWAAVPGIYIRIEEV